ncbi:unnamed protein product [Parascedosporium putredinis]|uniref:Sulfatase N-terminal domain-containing protein n=1 Tax=Parascedosporium putredinis TaxID=1442378 RepID=A0A9P1HBP0_9PEZI|nr:unnamed protein product [Parascedosporium putredinis]CAI8005085.1 unnamed protein product [Parascedosporium putredinis]
MEQPPVDDSGLREKPNPPSVPKADAVSLTEVLVCREPTSDELSPDIRFPHPHSLTADIDGTYRQRFEPDYEDPTTEPGRFLETTTRALHVEDNAFLSNLPQPWYSSDGYADKLIEYLSERNEQDRTKPFFAYLPFSAPHWPLQAPKKNMNKYKGLYADGPEVLRRQRLERLQNLGIIAPTAVPHPVVGMAGEEDEHQWDRLDEDTRQKSARAMEAYAGMVDRMDWNVGRVLEYLKKTGQYENTLIMFMSDNGAEGASYEAAPILGDQMMAHIAKYYDNSLENIGRGNSFVWYGNYWAQAATAPSRLFKMFSTEGGCRVPLIVKPALQTRAGPGAETLATDSIITDAFCTVMDVVPTILELAGLQHPGKEYADYAAGFEIAGSGALRRGDYKVTFVPAPRGRSDGSSSTFAQILAKRKT